MSRFLILDGYPREEREKFAKVGMTLAGELYRNMLERYVSNPKAEILFTSDSEHFLQRDFLMNFSAILWPGCSLTVYEDHWRVRKMLNIADLAFELGVPQFGSCWAAQVAVHLVGGKISPHPKGREIGISRGIYHTDSGESHPMYRQKKSVFEAFTSHDDYIESAPKQYVENLCSNEWCDIQSISVKYKSGDFWATQYHPEYNFYEMAKLFLARKEKLIRQKYFENEQQIKQIHDDFIQIENRPSKHLLWKYGLGDSMVDEKLRELEFFNWLVQFFPNLLK